MAYYGYPGTFLKSEAAQTLPEGIHDTAGVQPHLRLFFGPGVWCPALFCYDFSLHAHIMLEFIRICRVVLVRSF